MIRSQKRRMRDRNFVKFDWDEHWIRAFAICTNNGTSFDLFPPVAGYRDKKKSSKRTYFVDMQRQQGDWSQLVMSRDRYRCQDCGSSDKLEAHHIWPQSAYPHLRYLLNNGITLCRPCHEHASCKWEITPNQFRMLTLDTRTINANLQAEHFWDRYTAGLEKGRLLAFGIRPSSLNILEAEMTGQIDWFRSWAKLNDFYKRVRTSASSRPFPDSQYELDHEFRLTVDRFDPFRSKPASNNINQA